MTLPSWRQFESELIALVKAEDIGIIDQGSDTGDIVVLITTPPDQITELNLTYLAQELYARLQMVGQKVTV